MLSQPRDQSGTGRRKTKRLKNSTARHIAVGDDIAQALQTIAVGVEGWQDVLGAALQARELYGVKASSLSECESATTRRYDAELWHCTNLLTCPIGWLDSNPAFYPNDLPVDLSERAIATHLRKIVHFSRDPATIAAILKAAASIPLDRNERDSFTIEWLADRLYKAGQLDPQFVEAMLRRDFARALLIHVERPLKNGASLLEHMNLVWRLNDLLLVTAKLRQLKNRDTRPSFYPHELGPRVSAKSKPFRKDFAYASTIATAWAAGHTLDKATAKAVTEYLRATGRLNALAQLVRSTGGLVPDVSNPSSWIPGDGAAPLIEAYMRSAGVAEVRNFFKAAEAAEDDARDYVTECLGHTSGEVLAQAILEFMALARNFGPNYLGRGHSPARKRSMRGWLGGHPRGFSEAQTCANLTECYRMLVLDTDPELQWGSNGADTAEDRHSRVIDLMGYDPLDNLSYPKAPSETGRKATRNQKQFLTRTPLLQPYETVVARYADLT